MIYTLRYNGCDYVPMTLNKAIDKSIQIEMTQDADNVYIKVLQAPGECNSLRIIAQTGNSHRSGAGHNNYSHCLTDAYSYQINETTIISKDDIEVPRSLLRLEKHLLKYGKTMSEYIFNIKCAFYSANNNNSRRYIARNTIRITK